MKRSTTLLFIGAMLIFMTGCGAERNEEHSARSVSSIVSGSEDGTRGAANHSSSPQAGDSEGEAAKLLVQERGQMQAHVAELQLKQEQFLLDRMQRERVQRERGALRPTTGEEETFLNTLRELEEDILQALIAEAETKALGGEAADFGELKPELLRYMTEDMLGMWEHVYDKYPGWIMEPAGLVYTWAMFQPSFRIERQSKERASATFKINGDYHVFDGAKLVTYGLLYCDENEAWRIDSVEEEPLLYAFTLEEVTSIMDRIGEDVDYTGEDIDYYYFKPEDEAAQYTYKFHKKDGYYDIN
ncbi:hypothetical protein [Paenibacillus sp. J5C2022]|uniref:hypothetical protein n=1 Tax=Paenibacillus sp. J5C2022 TaxID=2977129 RepID=UPI0021D3326E|nr:hypothetical protein [Paenibacillus sp. J5C2022]